VYCALPPKLALQGKKNAGQQTQVVDFEGNEDELKREFHNHPVDQ